ncbi:MULTISPECIES: hypothetical protein [Providencia]|uniref:hypothetical protein n=1 Tax=Providencia TaxID=586 RepID=UPI001B361049|nr:MULTISPECIES: hypothetical protein [Providencia]MBQ0535456.1 hypothetical protein [Providencia huaxiensis]MBQ0587810.1 hypothetical protein [Providencia huaxiensis]MDI7240444.1 hypothetical protein [Providencia huaxiensis]
MSESNKRIKPIHEMVKECVDKQIALGERILNNNGFGLSTRTKDFPSDDLIKARKKLLFKK